MQSASEQIRRINELVGDLKKIGANVEGLEKEMDRLQFAIDTGMDLGNAAAETSAALAAYANSAYQACGEDAVRPGQIRPVAASTCGELDVFPG